MTAADDVGVRGASGRPFGDVRAVAAVPLAWNGEAGGKLLSNAGTQFDPSVVDVLLEAVGETGQEAIQEPPTAERTVSRRPPPPLILVNTTSIDFGYR